MPLSVTKIFTVNDGLILSITTDFPPSFINFSNVVGSVLNAELITFSILFRPLVLSRKIIYGFTPE